MKPIAPSTAFLALAGGGPQHIPRDFTLEFHGRGHGGFVHFGVGGSIGSTVPWTLTPSGILENADGVIYGVNAATQELTCRKPAATHGHAHEESVSTRFHIMENTKELLLATEENPFAKWLFCLPLGDKNKRPGIFTTEKRVKAGCTVVNVVVVAKKDIPAPQPEPVPGPEEPIDASHPEASFKPHPTAKPAPTPSHEPFQEPEAEDAPEPVETSEPTPKPAEEAEPEPKPKPWERPEPELEPTEASEPAEMPKPTKHAGKPRPSYRPKPQPESTPEPEPEPSEEAEPANGVEPSNESDEPEPEQESESSVTPGHYNDSEPTSEEEQPETGDGPESTESSEKSEDIKSTHRTALGHGPPPPQIETACATLSQDIARRSKSMTICTKISSVPIVISAGAHDQTTVPTLPPYSPTPETTLSSQSIDEVPEFSKVLPTPPVVTPWGDETSSMSFTSSSTSFQEVEPTPTVTTTTYVTSFTTIVPTTSTAAATSITATTLPTPVCKVAQDYPVIGADIVLRKNNLDQDDYKMPDYHVSEARHAVISPMESTAFAFDLDEGALGDSQTHRCALQFRLPFCADLPAQYPCYHFHGAEEELLDAAGIRFTNITHPAVGQIDDVNGPKPVIQILPGETATVATFDCGVGSGTQGHWTWSAESEGGLDIEFLAGGAGSGFTEGVGPFVVVCET